MFEIIENTFYYRNSQSVLMHIDLPELHALPPEVTYNSRRYELKSEFHITLLALKNVQLSDKSGRGLERFLGNFGRELRNNIVTVGDMRPPLSLCAKDKETSSIITPIEVIGLHQAIVELKQNGPSVPLPYPHVTLYTHGDRNGVGVQSAAQYAERCKKIKIPEIEAMLYTSPTQ